LRLTLVWFTGFVRLHTVPWFRRTHTHTHGSRPTPHYTLPFTPVAHRFYHTHVLHYTRFPHGYRYVGSTHTRVATARGVLRTHTAHTRTALHAHYTAFTPPHAHHAWFSTTPLPRTRTALRAHATAAVLRTTSFTAPGLVTRVARTAYGSHTAFYILPHHALHHAPHHHCLTPLPRTCSLPAHFLRFTRCGFAAHYRFTLRYGCYTTLHTTLVLLPFWDRCCHTGRRALPHRLFAHHHTHTAHPAVLPRARLRDCTLPHTHTHTTHTTHTLPGYTHPTHPFATPHGRFTAHPHYHTLYTHTHTHTHHTQFLPRCCTHHTLCWTGHLHSTQRPHTHF